MNSAAEIIMIFCSAVSSEVEWPFANQCILFESIALDIVEAINERIQECIRDI